MPDGKDDAGSSSGVADRSVSDVLRVSTHSSRGKRKADVAVDCGPLTVQRGGVADEPGLLAEDTEEVPSDTLAAMKLLKAQFPATTRLKCLPVALKSQLYSIVHCRTEVDRELDVLRSRNQVRVLKLPCGPDEYAVCLAEDYKAAAQQCSREAEASGASAAQCNVFTWFMDNVCPQCTTPNITRTDLLRYLSGGARAVGGQVSESHVSLLLHHGLLQRDDDVGFIFSLPNIGGLVGNVTRGKQELVRILGRHKLGEVLEKELMKKKLSKSCLGMRFHLRHAMGLGIAARLDSTCGPKIRLVKH